MTASTAPRPAPVAGRFPSWRRPDPWRAGVITVALLLTLPIATVFGAIFLPVGETWHHLVETVLADYVLNSLGLMLGVAVGVLSIGVTCAWLTANCHYPGRRLFEWALLLPLAIPAYIIAYTYTGMLDYPGPVQSALRAGFGWGYGDYWFPEIRSLGGAIAMLSLVLYPYVYLLARAAFLEQSLHALEAGRILGAGPWARLTRIALPGARPAIIAGLSLALMETLADYGTVQYFGVATFTTGIFRTWYGLDDSGAAAQLAALMMLFVFALILTERWSRRQARYHHAGQRSKPLPRLHLAGWRAALATAACALPLLLGFVLPVAQLTTWAARTLEVTVADPFPQLVVNTLALAASAALLALLLALFMAYGRRLRGGFAVTAAVRVAALGYAIPGTVIAVGVLIPFGWLDNTIDGWARARFDFATGLLLSGTLFALLFTYMVRFLAVSLQTVEAGLERVKPMMDESARTLGLTPGRVLARVHLPMLRGSLLTAILLVFVDVMKELPATLILRPFNFNTLAVRAYELASDERLAEAAGPAIAIVLAGIVPVILLSRSIARSRPAKDVH